MLIAYIIKGEELKREWVFINLASKTGFLSQDG